ncbi:MAG: DUF1648 domain-containing protein [Ferruginibacter sp.]|nr:DUF1648 domain-containing protein [Cytophagales bacterium]
MKSGFAIIRILRVFTLFGFIVALFVCYIGLPQQVAIHYDESGAADGFVDKSLIFYGLTAFVVLFNTALSVLAKLVPALPASRLKVPNRPFWTENRQALRDILAGWLTSLTALVNAFLVICLVVVQRLNVDQDVPVLGYGWLPVAGGILLLGWAAFLPLRLLVRSAAAAEE